MGTLIPKTLSLCITRYAVLWNRWIRLLCYYSI